MPEANNPYAPPATADSTAACGPRYWHLDGADLLARAGATLPKVDLESGAIGAGMKAKPLVGHTRGSFDVLGSLLVLGGYLLVTSFLDLGPWSAAMLILTVIVLRRLGIIGRTRKLVIWSFIEPHRARSARIRGSIQLMAMLLFLLVILASSSSSMVEGWLAGRWSLVLMSGMALFAGSIVWNTIARSKLRLECVSPEWLRISGIHPGALAVLRREEADLSGSQPGPASGRKRMIVTTYYHRYPLRMLLDRVRNPLIILRVALMKWLRSKLFVRESFHFTEAEARDLGTLHPQLGAACRKWLDDHPDWRFLNAEHLPSPAGDLKVETATLATTDQAHVLRIARAWMEQAPHRARNQYSFLTWLTNGMLIRTHDRPVLGLPLPAVRDFFARGGPEQVHQTHLRHISGQTPEPAPDADGLAARLFDEQLSTDRLLTEHGYQSAAREV